MKTAAMNKKCTSCGSLLAAEASFCPHCAAPQRNDTPGRWRRTALKGAAVHRSTFKNNGIGLHFNSKRSNFYNAEYDWNQFVGNGTAFLLENVPAAPPLAFPGTLFFENGEKFDNRCGKELDLSLARMDG